MRELLRLLSEHDVPQRPAALATVVSTTGSAPLPAGTSMLVLPTGAVRGSISGGCVDADVYEVARETLQTGQSSIRQYGADDGPFAIGLTCGGVLTVLVQRLDAASAGWVRDAQDAAAHGRRFWVETVLEDPDPGRVGSSVVTAQQPVAPARGVFRRAYEPAPRLIIVGSNQIAAALARVASALDQHVTVCDAGAVFATPARFPGADEVVADLPGRYLAGERDAGRLDERTAVCVLTHDAKVDVPVLQVALRAPLAYVGAMGSRRTHADRLQRLRAAGLTPAELARLSGPIGLDLRASNPGETAVSIVAELIALRTGGTGARLADQSGPIHGHLPPATPIARASERAVAGVCTAAAG